MSRRPTRGAITEDNCSSVHGFNHPKSWCRDPREERLCEGRKIHPRQSINRSIDEVYDPQEPDPPNDPNQVTIHFAIRWAFENSADRDADIQRLRDLVEARNNLIYHLLSEVVDFNSPESWRSIRGELETQQGSIRSQIKKLKQLLKMMQEAAAEFARP
jgi:hypothetical protein